ncbi:MAG: phage tail tape measure protein [Magnetococcales bacterium]|nr:phage tail tape measure protein [Magnetococcales bacterium]
MALGSLEFTLFMNTASIVQGMGSARKEVVSGLRGLSESARAETDKIQKAMEKIVEFRNLKQGVKEAQDALKKALEEVAKLENSFVGPLQKKAQNNFDKDLGRLQKAAEAASNALDENKKALSEHRLSMEQTSVAAKRLAEDERNLKAELQRVNAEYKAKATQLMRRQNAQTTIGYTPDTSNRQIAAVEAAYKRLADEGKMSAASLSRAFEQATTRILQIQIAAEKATRSFQDFQMLGIKSNQAVKNEIDRLRDAYDRLKGSPTATAQDLERASIALREKTVALWNTVRQGTQFYKDMGLVGIRSTKDIQREINELNAALARLRTPGRGALPTGDLDRAMVATKNKIDALKKSVEEQNPVFRAFQDLGMRSLASIRQEVNRLTDAYKTIKTSGTATATDLARAELELKAKTAELLAEVQRGSGVYKSFGALGVQSTQQINKEIATLEAAYRTLATSGKASTDDLARAQVALNSRIAEAKRTLTEGTQSFQDWRTIGVQSSADVANSIKEVRAAYDRLKGSATTTAQDLERAGIALQEKNAALLNTVRQGTQFYKDMGLVGIKSMKDIQTEIGNLNAALARLRSPGKSALPADDLARVMVATKDKIDALKKSVEEQNPVFRAFQDLGVKSAASVRQEIDRLIESYKTIKASGTATASDLARAKIELKTKTAELWAEVQHGPGVYKNLETLGVQSVRQINKEIAALEASFHTLKTSGKLSTEDLAQAQVALNTRIAALRRTLTEGTQSFQDWRTLGVRSSVDVANSIKDVRDAYARLKAEGKMSLAEQTRAWAGMKLKILEIQNSTGGWLEKLNQIKLAIAQVVATAAGLTLAVNAAIDFETAMSNVRKVVDFETPQEFKMLTEDIKGMSRVIPIAINDLTKIAEAGGQMGIAAKDIRGFTQSVAQISVAFNMSADDAANAYGKIKNIFRLSIAEMDNFADAINHIGNSSVASEREMLNVIMRAGAISKNFGLLNKEVAALAATFLAIGRPMEVAGSAINAMLTTLVTGSQREPAFKNAMLRIGLSAESMAEKISDKPQAALLEFLETVEKLDSKTRVITLENIFGRQWQDEVGSLVAGLDTYRQHLKLVENDTNFFNSTQKEFEIRLKSTQSQLNFAKNAFSEAAIALGDKFLPLVASAAQGLAKAMQSVVGVLNSPTVQAFAATAAAAGTLSYAIANASKVWLAFESALIAVRAASLTTGASLLALATNPYIAIPALIAAGVTAWVYANRSLLPSLKEESEALDKSREASEKHLAMVQKLADTFATASPGSKEYIAAQQELALIIPGANLLIDEQGRVLLNNRDAAKEATAALKEYLDLLKQGNVDQFALALANAGASIGEVSKKLKQNKKDLKDYIEQSKGTELSWRRIGSLVGFDSVKEKIKELNNENAELARISSESIKKLQGLAMGAAKSGIPMDSLLDSLEKITDLDTFTAVRNELVQFYRATEIADGKVGSLQQRIKNFSVAAEAQAGVVKKDMVDALGAAITQVGKFDEELNKHREKLKMYADEEVKLGQMVAKAADDKYATMSGQISAFHDKEMMAAERASEDVKHLAKEDNDFRIAEAERTVELVNSVENEIVSARQEESKRLREELGSRYGAFVQIAKKRLRLEKLTDSEINAISRYSEANLIKMRTTFLVQEQQAKLSLERSHLREMLKISDDEYRTKLANAKNLKLSEATINAERLANQKGYWEKLRDAAKASVDASISEQKRLMERNKQIHEEKKSSADAIGDMIQSIEEKTMDEMEIYASRQERIQKLKNKASEDLRRDDIKSAEEYNAKLIQLVNSTADEVKVGDHVFVGKNAAANRAKEQLIEAGKLQQEIKNRELAVNNSATQEAKGMGEKAVQTFQTAQQMIDSLAKQMIEIQQKQIAGNKTAITEISKSIDEINAKKDITLKVKAVFDDSVKRLDTLVADIASGNIARVNETINQVNGAFVALKENAKGWNSEVQAQLNLPSQKASIEGLTNMVTGFFDNLKTYTDDPVNLVIEGKESEDLLQRIIDRLSQIKDKTVTIDIIEKRMKKTVEQKAKGGIVGFARGGFLPGWGQKDDVEALLQRGEFVFRKEVVKHYGLPLMNAMNNMKAPVQRFAHGGAVQPQPRIHSFEIPRIIDRIRIPTLPRAAYATGGAVQPKVEGVMRLELVTPGETGKPPSLGGSRGEVKKFMRALNNLNKGLVGG